ncbi:MAG: hypothetical protein WCL23_01590 [Candidatus Moraniibacteriota bacterium]
MKFGFDRLHPIEQVPEKTPESVEWKGVEKEKVRKYSSRTRLSFFRHGDKAKPAEGQTADSVLLSEKGRGEAVAASNPETNVRQSIAFGSTKPRAEQTAAFKMAGSEDAITGDETLDELKAKFDAALAQEAVDAGVVSQEALDNGFELNGKKTGVDSRLDFALDMKGEYGTAMVKSIGEKRYLSFLIEQSDALAEQLGNTTDSRYSDFVSNIAEVLVKYAKVEKNWDQLVAQDAFRVASGKESKGYTETLERFFGSHQGIGESFLAKLIETTKGVEERNAFVESLGNVGFGDVEGFTVDIMTVPGEDEPVVNIAFTKEYVKADGTASTFVFNEDVPLQTIAGFVKEKKEVAVEKADRAV